MIKALIKKFRGQPISILHSNMKNINDMMRTSHDSCLDGPRRKKIPVCSFHSPRRLHPAHPSRCLRPSVGRCAYRQPLFLISHMAWAPRRPLPPECASVRWADHSIRLARFPLNYSNPTRGAHGTEPTSMHVWFFYPLDLRAVTSYMFTN
jgi:hypothetical protein